MLAGSMAAAALAVPAGAAALRDDAARAVADEKSPNEKICVVSFDPAPPGDEADGRTFDYGDQLSDLLIPASAEAETAAAQKGPTEHAPAEGEETVEEEADADRAPSSSRQLPSRRMRLY